MGFIIKDFFPLNRKNSKYFHVIITTKNNFRAYISFNTEINNEPIENEIDKLIKNKNSINRNRPTMNWSLSIKIIPEMTNANSTYNNFGNFYNENSGNENYSKNFYNKGGLSGTPGAQIGGVTGTPSGQSGGLFRTPSGGLQKFGQNFFDHKLFFLDQKFLIFYKDELKEAILIFWNLKKIQKKIKFRKIKI